jgi:nucleotide-binding universal stress UspA family protein
MFKNILVALDGSPQSERIVPLAKSLARSSGGELHLVRVIDEHASYEQIDESVRNMAAVTTGLVKEKIVPDIHIARGQVVDQILREVELVNAGVLLMSTGSHSGLSHALLGSVTEQVFARATVPVLALSSHAELGSDLRSILVPRDASLGSAQALSAAKSIARATGARIELLHVVEPLVRYFRGRYIEPGFEEEIRGESEEELTRVASTLEELGFKASGRAVIGQPGSAIVAVANEIDAGLIVMTTNGLTGLRPRILGSVTHEVLRNSNAPMLLLHFNISEGVSALREEAQEASQLLEKRDSHAGAALTAPESSASPAQFPPR